LHIGDLVQVHRDKFFDAGYGLAEFFRILELAITC
jgi:hypothetical protein